MDLTDGNPLPEFTHSFAGSFRAEIEDAYLAIINDRKDSLEIARIRGMSAIAEWIHTKLWVEIQDALDSGDPDSIHGACAKMGLSALLLRDSSDAFGGALGRALASPDDEREERVDAVYVALAGAIVPSKRARKAESDKP